MMPLDLMRGGAGPFRLVDTDDTAEHGFWQRWAAEDWEPFGLAVLEEHCAERGGDAIVFDIGAWVGPYTLLAAHYGAQVLAVEPDPVAYAGLVANLAENRTISRYVATIQEAVTPDGFDTIELRRRGSWGDSMSSITRSPSEHQGRMAVKATTIRRLCELYAVPTLLKMDIEGGESVVIPDAGPWLRQYKHLGVQLLLSLHPLWYGDAGAAAIDDELRNWHVEPIEGDPLGFQTILARPK